MDKVIELKKEYPVAGGKLYCYPAEYPFDDERTWKRPIVIVVPGGAYGMISKREGSVVAVQFLARGFHAFVLEYLTCNDHAYYPEQLKELACAVDYVKKNAESFCGNADEVFVVGFSAGGHLSANLAVGWNEDPLCAMGLCCKPTAVALGYPVITAEEAYKGSHENLLMGYSSSEREKLLPLLNLDRRVTAHTPPTFMWTTAEDELVPAQNTLRFALALAGNGIPYELHVYPQRIHGGSTCDYEINDADPALRKNAAWLDACAQFFRLYTKEQF